MPSQKKKLMSIEAGWKQLLTILGVSSLLLFGITVYQSISSADELEGLQGLHISPITPEGRTVPPGGTLRLTAIGEFATMEIGVRAQWSIVGDDLGSSLESCSSAKRCILQAGTEGGNIIVRAEAGAFVGEAEIAIHLASPFTDELPGWADGPILHLNQLGIIRGYENGTYGPGDPVTRGQFVTLLYRLALHTGLTEELTSDLCPPSRFADIPTDHFAFLPACFYDRTAVGGHTTDDFEPDLPALREQVATMVARTYAPSLLDGHGFTGDRANEPYEGGPFFDDIPQEHPSFFDTRTVQTIDIMTGYPNGDFGLGDQLNRAQAAVIIERLLQEIDDYNIESFWQLGSGDQEDDDQEEPPSAPVSSVTVGCAVHNGSIDIPGPPAPPTGTNYARHDLAGAFPTDSGLRAACTQSIFDDLMEEYCVGATAPGIWRIVRYGQGLASWQNTDPHLCPSGSVTSAAPVSSVTVGCAVHNGSIDIPGPPAPPTGTNYARHDLAGAFPTDSGLRAACTQSIFDDLMEEYCVGATAPGIWRIVRYGQGLASWQNTDPHLCP